MMRNKLLPILANSVVLLVVTTISGLITNAQKLDRPAELNTGVVESAIVEVLARAVVDNAEISKEVDAIEDVISDVEEIYVTGKIEPAIIKSHVRGGVDLDYIRPFDELDIAQTVHY